MPNWNALLDEARAVGGSWDVIRRKYLKNLFDLTGRNVIAYYSGWLQKRDTIQLPNYSGFSINDSDKNGFMSTIHELDRSKGLDLILHTPGGDMAATESLVDYLRSMFGTDIRAIIPQLAMSGGTMISCSCKEIIMGKHSSLGPIDPQFGGLPAHGIIEEFNRASKEVATTPHVAPLWQPIFAKYSPSLLGECDKAIKWAEDMVKEWLMTGMFLSDEHPEDKAVHVIQELGDHALTKSHSRHISIRKASEIGLKAVALEDDNKLQDAVLTIHHAFIQSIAETPAVKIIENQNGIAYIQAFQLMQTRQFT
jgi:ClpP class serine protease